MLVLLVLGFTGTVVAYSAINSFSTPQWRRAALTPTQPGAAVFGDVVYMEDENVKQDGGAAVLLWPVGSPPVKFDVTENQLFGNLSPRMLRPLVFAPVADDGRYVVSRTQLMGTVESQFYILAISKHFERETPIADGDVSVLRQYFTDVEHLLGKRYYSLNRTMLGTGTVNELSFRFNDATPQFDSAGSLQTKPPQADTRANTSPSSTAAA